MKRKETNSQTLRLRDSVAKYPLRITETESMKTNSDCKATETPRCVPHLISENSLCLGASVATAKTQNSVNSVPQWPNPPAPGPALVSCPFCGGDAESDTRQGFRRMKDGAMSNAVAIYCTKCTVQMTMCHEDFREYAPDDLLTILTEAWNLRAGRPTAAQDAGPAEGQRALARNDPAHLRSGK